MSGTLKLKQVRPMNAAGKPVCFMCKTATVKHRYYPCWTCRKLWQHTKDEIERLRFNGLRFDIDFSDAPIADQELIRVAGAIVSKLTTPRAAA